MSENDRAASDETKPGETDWSRFLREVREAGGSTDMSTSATGRYPWAFHFCRGQADKLGEVVVYANCRERGVGRVITSPPRDWRTREAILADYADLKASGALFNDTAQALAGVTT